MILVHKNVGTKQFSVEYRSLNFIRFGILTRSQR